jgi:hypothetical protein
MLREHESDDPSIAMPPAALLDAVGDVAGAHVAVLGAGALPVLCGLIRRGAAAAAELALSDRAIADPAEIVVVPRIASGQQAAQAIALARRALLPCGRIVMRDVSGVLERDIAALLRSAGFVGIRTGRDADGAIVSGEWPMFGPVMALARA